MLRNDMVCIAACLQGWTDPLGDPVSRWVSIADNVLARSDLTSEYGPQLAAEVTAAAHRVKSHFEAAGG